MNADRKTAILAGVLYFLGLSLERLAWFLS